MRFRYFLILLLVAKTEKSNGILYTLTTYLDVRSKMLD